MRGEVKWQIFSWLRSKWLWATKLGKNYVVCKIYIRFSVSQIVTFLPDIKNLKLINKYYSNFFFITFLLTLYVYVIPLMKLWYSWKNYVFFCNSSYIPANFLTFIGVTFFILRVPRFFIGSNNIWRCPKTFWRCYEEFRLTRTWEHKGTLTSLLKKRIRRKLIIHIDFPFLSLVLVSLNKSNIFFKICQLIA